jgi:hypothetical protein
MLSRLPDDLAALIMPRFHSEALTILNRAIKDDRSMLAKKLSSVLQYEPEPAALFAKLPPKQTTNAERSNQAWRPVKHDALLSSFYSAFPNAKERIIAVIAEKRIGNRLPQAVYDELKAEFGLTGKHSHWLTAALRDCGCYRASWVWHVSESGANQ